MAGSTASPSPSAAASTLPLPLPLPLPIAPATQDELYQQYHICAVLLPIGQAAVRGFSDLVEQILSAPSAHQSLLDQQCIFLYSAQKRTLDAILDTGAATFGPLVDQTTSGDLDDYASAFPSDSTCPSSPSDDAPCQLWHGFVAISTRRPPELPAVGWSIGYQPHLQTLSRKPPDIPLCSEERGRQAGMHARHIVINFMQGAATLALKQIHQRPQLTCDTTPLRQGVSHPLVKRMQAINIGTLQYWIIYLRLSSTVVPALESDIRAYIQRMPGGNTLIPSASATPNDNDKFVGDWRVMGVAGRGASTIMASALHKHSGILAVVRHKQQNEPGYAKFLQELDMERSTTQDLSAYRFGRCHVQSLCDSVSYHGSGETYAFYQPNCPTRLDAVLRNDDYSSMQRQVLFAQLVLSIQDLHAVGRVHGDITPRNVCIQSTKPLSLVLIDTASIRKCPDQGIRCTPGQGGTIGYLAPEQEGEPTYGQPVDVWAVGCIGVELLLRHEHFASQHLTTKSHGGNYNPWRPVSTYEPTKAPREESTRVTKKKFLSFRATLRKYPEDSKEGLLYRLLDPDPTSRCTAGFATKHTFVQSVYDAASEASQTAQPGSKRKA